MILFSVPGGIGGPSPGGASLNRISISTFALIARL